MSIRRAWRVAGALGVALVLLAGGCAREARVVEGVAPAGPVPPARGAGGADNGPAVRVGYDREVTEASGAARAWFNAGLLWTYGFNHDEAVRCFEHAARLAPRAAMPWWGKALAHGININDPKMTPERWRVAAEAVGEAKKRLEGASAVERSLVEALERRYAWPTPADQRPLDEAYAEAMGRVHARFPDDPDVATVYAESLMNLQPWDLWTPEGEPKGRTEEIVRVLEGGLSRHADHPGLMHLYIHAVEASPEPGRAEAAADRLLDRVPWSGHLVHMPAHIYARVGRYADCAETNARAAAVDRAYMATATTAPGMYWVYYAHNLHFLAYASMMEGREGAALEAAGRLEREIPEAVMKEVAPLVEGMFATRLHVLVRFGRWEKILREPEPVGEHRLVSRAAWRYARGVALAALGRPGEAREEARAFEAAARAVPEDWVLFNNKVSAVLPIARAMLEGEIAYREGRVEEAFAALRRGIEHEDGLVYDEPPGWMLPVRHALGALLVGDGRFAEAEAVYREDQRRHPGNGWSLLGLKQALEGQGRQAEAAALEPALARAWARADVRPGASCLCQVGPRAKP